MPARALHVTITGDPKPFQAALAKAGAATSAFGAKQQSTSAKMAATGTMLRSKVTLPILALGGAAAKMSLDFNASMGKIQRLVGASSSQVASYKKSVLSMASETGHAPKELADALFFVTSAGLKGKTALGALEISAKASAAGLGETKVVADAVTSAMNAYGPSNLSAAHSASVLTGAVREGKMEASSLSPVIGRVIPLAEAMGVSFDQVGAGMASLTRTGASAAEAATSMRGIFSTFAKPTTKTTDALKSMGMSVDSVRKSIKEKGLLSTLMEMRTEAKKNGVDFAKLFPNVRALNGFLSLTGRNAKNNAGIFKRMGSDTDAAGKAFGKLADKPGFKLKQAFAGLQAAMIEFGDVIVPIVVPVISKVVTALAHIGHAFSGLPSGIRSGVVGFALFAAAAGPLLIVGAKLINAYKVVKGAFIALKGAMLITRVQLIALKVQQLAVAAASIAMRGAVIAANAGMMILRGGMIALRAIMVGMRVVAIAAFGPIGIAIMAIVAIGALVVTHWTQVKAALTTVWNAIKTAFTATWNAIKAVVMVVVGFIVAYIRTEFNIIKTIVTTIWAGVRAVVVAAWNAIKTVVTKGVAAVLAVIRAYVGAYKAAGTAIFRAVAAGVRAVVSAVIAAGRFVITRVVAVVRGYVGVWKTVGGFLFRALANGVRAVAGVVIAAGRFVITRVISGVRAFVGAALSAGASLARAIGSGIRKLAGAVVDAAKHVARTALGGFKAAVSGAIEIGKAIVRGIIDGIKALAGAAASAAADVAKGALRRAKSLLHIHSPSGVFANEVGKPISEGMAAGIASAAPKVHAAIKALTPSEVLHGALGGGNSRLFGYDAELDRIAKTLDRLGDRSDAAGKKLIRALNSRALSVQAARDKANAIAAIANSLTDLAQSAGQAFRAGRETSIDAAGAAAKNTPQARELAAIQARQSAAEGAKEVDATTRAQARLDRVRLTGTAKQIAAAQAAYDAARATQLTREVEANNTAVDASVEAQKAGLDAEETNFRNSLATRLNEEWAQLANRTENYKQFANDVAAILGPLGLAFVPSADEELAVNPTRPGKTPKKPRRRRKKHRAAGGTVIAGELTRLNELGAETLTLPGGTRITPASIANDRQGPTIGQLIINAEGAAGNDPHALASMIGFRLGALRR